MLFCQISIAVLLAVSVLLVRSSYAEMGDYEFQVFQDRLGQTNLCHMAFISHESQAVEAIQILQEKLFISPFQTALVDAQTFNLLQVFNDFAAHISHDQTSLFVVQHLNSTSLFLEKLHFLHSVTDSNGMVANVIVLLLWDMPSSFLLSPAPFQPHAVMESEENEEKAGDYNSYIVQWKEEISKEWKRLDRVDINGDALIGRISRMVVYPMQENTESMTLSSSSLASLCRYSSPSSSSLSHKSSSLMGEVKEEVEEEESLWANIGLLIAHWSHSYLSALQAKYSPLYSLLWNPSSISRLDMNSLFFILLHLAVIIALALFARQRFFSRPRPTPSYGYRMKEPDSRADHHHNYDHREHPEEIVAASLPRPASTLSLHTSRSSSPLPSPRTSTVFTQDGSPVKLNGSTGYNSPQILTPSERQQRSPRTSSSSATFLAESMPPEASRMPLTGSRSQSNMIREAGLRETASSSTSPLRRHASMLSTTSRASSSAGLPVRRSSRLSGNSSDSVQMNEESLGAYKSVRRRAKKGSKEFHEDLV